MRSSTLLLPVILVMLSCTADKEPVSQEERKSDVYIELLSEIRTFERSYGDCDNDTTNTCTVITLSYPYFTGTLNPEAEHTINEKISSVLIDNMLYDSTVYESLDEFATAFISDYQEIRNDFESAFGWQYEGDVSVLRNDSTNLVLKFEQYVYTGGAHGMFTVRYLNMDPENGALRTMNDLFRQPFADNLNVRIKKAFLDAKGLNTDEELSNAGYWFEDGRFYNENVAILQDSILFYYNQYDIAPYAMGPTRLAVPISLVEDLLLPRFSK